jgi:hypothetical protein
MKGFGGRKISLCLLQLINQKCKLSGLLASDNGHSAWPLFDDQPKQQHSGYHINDNFKRLHIEIFSDSKSGERNIFMTTAILEKSGGKCSLCFTEQISYAKRVLFNKPFV